MGKRRVGSTPSSRSEVTPAVECSESGTITTVCDKDRHTTFSESVSISTLELKKRNYGNSSRKNNPQQSTSGSSSLSSSSHTPIPLRGGQLLKTAPSAALVPEA